MRANTRQYQFYVMLMLKHQHEKKGSYHRLQPEIKNLCKSSRGLRTVLNFICYIMKSDNCNHLRHITLLLVDKVTDFLPFTFFHIKVVRGQSQIILHRKSSIRSRNLIQVYSIRSRRIKKCNSPRCQENSTF